jgi:DNA polymerase III subunit delta
MAVLKPAYLIHGDDHGAIAERRLRLRSLAESTGDAASVELLEGEAATPHAVALALDTMTFALGQRVLIVDGAERYKEPEVREHLLGAMAAIPPDTTVAFFAREDGRAKAPSALHEAVEAAGGQIACEAAVKPWELAGWVREQAGRLGLSLDPAAAKALIAQVGERQQRLLRELEKLALGFGPARDAGASGEGARAGGPAPAGAAGGPGEASAAPARVGVEQIEALAAYSTAWRAFSFADALVACDAPGALRSYLRLRAQGERLGGLIYLMASRLREAEAVAMRLQAGESPAAIKRGLRMPSKAADRFIADVAKTEPERLQRALRRIAALELDTRGGPPLSRSRTPASSLEEDTLAVRAVLAIAA